MDGGVGEKKKQKNFKGRTSDVDDAGVEMLDLQKGLVNQVFFLVKSFMKIEVNRPRFNRTIGFYNAGPTCGYL